MDANGTTEGRDQIWMVERVILTKQNNKGLSMLSFFITNVLFDDNDLYL